MCLSVVYCLSRRHGAPSMRPGFSLCSKSFLMSVQNAYTQTYMTASPRFTRPEHVFVEIYDRITSPTSRSQTNHAKREEPVAKCMQAKPNRLPYSRRRGGEAPLRWVVFDRDRLPVALQPPKATSRSTTVAYRGTYPKSLCARALLWVPRVSVRPRMSDLVNAGAVVIPTSKTNREGGDMPDTEVS